MPYLPVLQYDIIDMNTLKMDRSTMRILHLTFSDID